MEPDRQKEALQKLYVSRVIPLLRGKDPFRGNYCVYSMFWKSRDELPERRSN